LVITSSSRGAEDLAHELRELHSHVLEFPAWETLPHERLSPRSDTVARRIATLNSLTNLKKEDFTIFPNPTNGNFTLKCISDGLKKYTITDINAKMIVEEKIIGYETPVDAIGILNPGIYFFNIKDEQSHSIYTEKIIIQ
jgi:transcription-repair coupling factor (superfamily II helicase)